MHSKEVERTEVPRMQALVRREEHLGITLHLFIDAEAIHQRALAGREQHLGVDHLATLRSMNNLALVYRQQGRYGDAEKLHRRALTGYKKHVVADHPDTLDSLAGCKDRSPPRSMHSSKQLSSSTVRLASHRYGQIPNFSYPRNTSACHYLIPYFT
jgi:hypothetical protein